MGMVLKCSSRITHLILPERKKRSTSNEKRGLAAVRVAERGSNSKREEAEIVHCKVKSNRMKESRGMEEHKHNSLCN